jgi:hypothetical protein
MGAERGDDYRAAIAIVARIVDVLDAGRERKSKPSWVADGGGHGKK